MSDNTPSDTQIVDVPVDEELADSYLEYALSVIVSRAIPDARDGLKPVQRRLIYAMWESGLRSDRPHRKSVSAVGDTMKKFHPHGDASIYDTLVRLSQPWVMGIPLVDGHGNMGSLDDGPAAARYTEARLTAAAEALIASVDEDTVALIDNFDGSHSEPVVLPAAIPTLLVNGASGIAVGMATNIPPHNLGEVTNACIHLLRHPDATVTDLVRHIPAPDFPTGGVIVGDVSETMLTGRGPIRVRARTRIEQLTPRRQGIVVTELPYNVGPEKVIARVRQLVEDRKLEGISDVKDLSGRKVGTRLVFEIRAGFDPGNVAEELFRLTPLEESFNVNMVALIDNKPVQCTLVDLCRTFLDHRLDVLRRSTKWRLRRAEQRLHLIDGLITAVSELDAVISVIRTSKDTVAARKALKKALTLTDAQVEHVLELPLRRLTALEIDRLHKEHRDIVTDIARFRELLADPEKQKQQIEQDLRAVAGSFGRQRRTSITPGSERDASVACPIGASFTVVTDGSRVWAVADETEPGAGVKSAAAAVRGEPLWAITADGRCVEIPTGELPFSPFAVDEYVERSTIVGLSPTGSVVGLMLADGTVKRVDASSLSAIGKTATAGMTIIGSPTVVAGFAAPDDFDIVAVTDDAQLLRFPATTVRPQGRSASGMAGVKLNEGASVIHACAVPAGENHPIVVSITDGGSVKTTSLGEFPTKGRNGQGMRCHIFKAADSRLAAAAVVADIVQVEVIDRSGARSETPPVSKRTAASVHTDAASVHLRSVRANAHPAGND